jgi:hypothetical protein
MKGADVFQGLINNVKSAAGSIAAKYAARASVAVPFIVALGFATAGTTLMLVEQFGHRNAYFIVASGFGAIGLLGAFIVWTSEQDEVIAAERAAQAKATGVTTDAALTGAIQMPLALLGGLVSSPAGPASVLGLARLVGRNLPLVLLLIAMGALFWPKPSAGTEPHADADENLLRLNGGFPSQRLSAAA